VEELVSKARKKAEDFLFKEAAKISDDIKKEKEDILHPPYDDTIALRFEAHAYLAHKNRDLKSKYAKELRDLWLHWKKTPYKGNTDWQFWPFAGSDIDTEIAMIRAIEILGVPGFHYEFDSSIRALEGWLIKPPLDIYCEPDYWHIFRSLAVQDILKQFIQNIAFMVLENVRAREYNLSVYRYDRKGEFESSLDAHTSSIIFFVVSQLGEDYLNTAKLAIDNIIKYQEKNGSMLNDIIDTCSFINAISLTKTDPSKIIRQKALEWLLKRQNNNGSWDHSLCQYLKSQGRNREVLNYQVLSTVLVLETIDLVTNHEPLPSWIPKEEPIFIRERKLKKAKIIPFPMPKGTTWEDVTIRFISNEEIQIRAGEVRESRNYRQMDFEYKHKRPDIYWETLKLFAKKDGTISWKDVPGDERELYKKRFSTLRKRLKDYFGINEDPIPHKTEVILCPQGTKRKERYYEPRFKIEIPEELRDEIFVKMNHKYGAEFIADEQIRDVFETDIEQRELQHKSRINQKKKEDF